jgi:hypothetical protein
VAKKENMPDPSESMDMLSDLVKQRDNLKKTEALAKAKLTETRNSIRVLDAKIDATIKGETEPNLFSGVGQPAAAGVQKPAGWGKTPLRDLPGVTAKDADVLSGEEGINTVGEWDEAVSESPPEKKSALFKRVEKAVQAFLSGQTKPATTTAE